MRAEEDISDCMSAKRSPAMRIDILLIEWLIMGFILQGFTRNDTFVLRESPMATDTPQSVGHQITVEVEAPSSVSAVEDILVQRTYLSLCALGRTTYQSC